MARRSLAQLWATLFAAQALFVGAVEVRFERVAENVYAHVGDIGTRSVANEGLCQSLRRLTAPPLATSQARLTGSLMTTARLNR